MEPWEQIATDASKADDAARTERAVCAALVRAEIAAGEARGVPANAAVMVILHRLAAAIEQRTP